MRPERSVALARVAKVGSNPLYNIPNGVAHAPVCCLAVLEGVLKSAPHRTLRAAIRCTAMHNHALLFLRPAGSTQCGGGLPQRAPHGVTFQVVLAVKGKVEHPPQLILGAIAFKQVLEPQP